MSELNLALPGNQRYQPRDLKPYFGYDNLYRWLVKVEIAALEVLGELGVIPEEEMKELTPELRDDLFNIITSEVDEIERSITKHDVRALVKKMQEKTGPVLGRWVHVPLTSYDPIESGRALQFRTAYREVIRPGVLSVMQCLVDLIGVHYDSVQIGRTHGQHALPITVGFWLATILDRVIRNLEMMDLASSQIVGKISGPVGAHNAQLGMNLDKICGEVTFEERVLLKLGLSPARISTQILPPEPTAYFLFSCTMMSGAFAQLGRDCRHLMRSEIGEIREEFQAGQVGSSTMAHKRNPINFENMEGMFIRTKNEFGKVMDTLISEHQRDLVGSCVARDFPIILVNLEQQLSNLLRGSADGTPFLKRISVDSEACERNFAQSSKFIMAEPIYIALQMAGYKNDAHHLVNHVLMPIAQKKDVSLVEALSFVAEEDEIVDSACREIPNDLMELFSHPEQYIGDAENQCFKVIRKAISLLNG